MFFHRRLLLVQRSSSEESGEDLGEESVSGFEDFVSIAWR